MNTQIGAAIFAVGLGLLGVAHADSWDSFGNRNVTVQNNSAYTINQLFIARVGTGWPEGDLLGRYTLAPGYQYTVHENPGEYAVKLVDADGDTCFVSGVDIRGDRTLKITTDMLMHCEGYR
jgi:hypothetical protein